MMLPEGENGLLLNEQQIQDLREARNKMRLPKSLSSLAIRSVTRHLFCFVCIPDSPLKYLSNTVVQQLLSKIASNIKKEKTKDVPISILEDFLVLLVNPNVTELDCTVFEVPYSDSMRLRFCFYLLVHALRNCPNIREIIVPNKHDIFRWSLENRWKNLTTIICSSEFICTKNSMAFLQENFPNIEVLAVRIHITGGYSAQTMLYHFIKWKRLHTLNLLHFVDDFDRGLYDSVIPEFFTDVAGAVPSLQNFDMNYINDASKFIDLFGEKYPKKKCLVDKLRIKEGLKRKWPKNLTVKHLIIGRWWREMSDTEIENLSTLECTLDLTMNCKLAQQMYKVLDCIGGLVKSLTINSSDSEIIVERMLAACPNLEHFKFVLPREVIEDSNYNMSPAAFKNYKSFEIQVPDEYSWEIVLQQVFRKFLIGTEVCETLKLYNYDQLEAAEQVAFVYPESLQKLRELHFIPYNIFFRTYTRDRMNEVLLKYDKRFYELLTCCHKLERIFLYVENVENVKQQKQENRYDLTIKSINPHFIKYCKK